MDLLTHFQRTLREMEVLKPADPVVLGVSGGADSLVLLHLFVRSREALAIRPHVVHVNHLIRGQHADDDAAYVEQIARSWGIPVRVERVDVPALARARRLSLEEAARQARYTVLGGAAAEIGAGVIAVAHNADDQAETVLMHLLRGSGLAGLRGMLPVTPLSEYHLVPAEDVGAVRSDAQHPQPPLPSIRLIRPLLDIPRVEIDAYCAAQGFVPRVDATNLDATYFRNRLRHEVLPMLEAINPGIRANLGRTATVIAADYEVLNARIDAAWAAITVEELAGWVRFDLVAWRDLPLGLQRALIRHAAYRLRPRLRDVTFEHVEAAVRVGQTGETGARATLPAGLMLTVDYAALVIASVDDRPPPPDWPLLESGATFEIGEPGAYPLPGSAWRFVLEAYEGPRQGPDWEARIADPWAALLSADLASPPLRLRARRPGYRFQPQGARGTAKLADFMINVKIPAAWRDHLPVLVCGDQIVWVCGFRVDERFIVRPETRSVWLARFEKV